MIILKAICWVCGAFLTGIGIVIFIYFGVKFGTLAYYNAKKYIENK